LGPHWGVATPGVKDVEGVERAADVALPLPRRVVLRHDGPRAEYRVPGSL